MQVRLTDKTEELARLSTQVLQAQTNFEHYTEAVPKKRVKSLFVSLANNLTNNDPIITHQSVNLFLKANTAQNCHPVIFSFRCIDKEVKTFRKK